jgi:hypothetical protein
LSDSEKPDLLLDTPDGHGEVEDDATELRFISERREGTVWMLREPDSESDNELARGSCFIGDPRT